MHFNLLRTLFITLMAVTVMGAFSMNARAEDEKVSEKVSEAAHDTKRAAKKTVRKASDETCEMVNGKMKCVGKKMKHAAQNAGDKLEDAVD